MSTIMPDAVREGQRLTLDDLLAAPHGTIVKSRPGLWHKDPDGTWTTYGNVIAADGAVFVTSEHLSATYGIEGIELVHTAPTPTPPATTRAPRWAAAIGPWRSTGGGNSWERVLQHDVTDDMVVSCWQTSPEAGKVIETTPTIDGWGLTLFDDTSGTAAQEARQIAYSLLAAADIIDGPSSGSADHVPTQYLLVQAVRARIKAAPIGQNEVAVAAGYGTSEFSDFMTGKRVMDLGDVERIARALGVDPFDLMVEAGR